MSNWAMILLSKIILKVYMHVQLGLKITTLANYQELPFPLEFLHKY